jgi:TonB family protein
MRHHACFSFPFLKFIISRGLLRKHLLGDGMNIRNFWKGPVTFTKVSSVLLFTFACLFFISSTSSQEARKLVKRIEPIYPELAGRMKMTGTVKVEITIRPDGSVRDVRILGGNPVLAAAVEEAVKQWKYSPSPAETTKDLEFRF